MKTRWIVALVIALLVLFAMRPRQRPTADAPGIPAVSNPAPSGTTQSPGASAPILPPSTAPAANPPIPPIAVDSKMPAPGGVPAAVPPPVPPSSAVPPAAASVPQPVPALQEIRDEIDNVQLAFRDYRTVLGENPIGSNAEITKALTGDNLKQVKIPIPEGSSRNADGEMCDRWGTPYFFHQLSGKQMEIHSAGPDRKMGTGDDVVVK